jgi:exodeoxyribonuclease V beta subunit
MSAQIAQACQLWLSAKLPPLGDAGPAGFCLKDIDETKILSEIRFALRSYLGSESVEGIKALFEDEFTTHYPRPGKGATPLAGVSMSKKRVEGVFTGVADLIFMHDGRFYIVDWKTNFLGNQVADYDRATVDLEMAESFYHLQYSLYASALDAYLSQTMGAAWSYDPPSKSPAANTATFGGVYYLFLRAFGHAGRGDIGCHHYRPTKAFIEKLRLQLANPVNLSPKNEPTTE